MRRPTIDVLARAGAFAGTVLVVVLAARTLAYALAPGQDELAARLEAAGGGVRPLQVALVAMAIAASASAATLGLVALGVRERCELELDRWAREAPALPLRALPARAAVLTAVAALAYATLESIVHVRAGLGFHGLHCLAGPVHANALPLLAALSLLATSLRTALALVLTALRRFVAGLVRRRPSRRPAVRLRPQRSRFAPGRLLDASTPARGPPCAHVP